ncbi:MAG: hypothetical protein VCA74_03620 [Deltaproteobacteria bacterium]
MNGSEVKNDQRHLLCYPAKRAKYEPRHVPRYGLYTANSLAAQRLDTKKEYEL